MFKFNRKVKQLLEVIEDKPLLDHIRSILIKTRVGYRFLDPQPGESRVAVFFRNPDEAIHASRFLNTNGLQYSVHPQKPNILLISHLVSEDGAAAPVNTTTSALGPTQAHSPQIGKSGDFYAPGDNRNLFGTKVLKPKKFKAPGFKKGKVIRRTFPGM